MDASSVAHEDPANALAAVSLPPDIAPDHSSALARFLEGNPNLRMALTSDYSTWDEDKEWLAKMYANPNPYYVASDFNGDGRNDFAAVLIDETIAQQNADGGFGFNCVLVLFEALGDGGFKLAFMENGTGTPEGSVLFQSREGQGVAVGKFESHASPITYRPGGTYALDNYASD